MCGPRWVEGGFELNFWLLLALQGTFFLKANYLRQSLRMNPRHFFFGGMKRACIIFAASF